MTRNLRTLGLAFVAACAMSAVLAAGVQANLGTIEADVGGGHAFLTGVPITHDGSPHHRFEMGAGTITCEETLFEGTVEDGDTELSIEPTYNTCTTFPIIGGSFTTTVLMEGCEYRFTGGNQTPGEPDHFEGITTSLICPGGGPRIKVYKTSAHGGDHSEGNRRCEYVVTPFTTHKLHNTAENIPGGTDDVEVTSEWTGVALTRVFGTLLQCGGANQMSDYVGGTTLRAYSGEAHVVQVDLTLTDSDRGC